MGRGGACPRPCGIIFFFKMGESDRYLDYNKRKLSFGDDRNALVILVSINAIVFLILAFIKALYFIIQLAPEAYQNNVVIWFLMPAKFSAMSYRPWTVLTYMFTHQGLINFLTNMLWLWAFGSILQSLSGNKKVIPLFIYGGLAGAVTFIAANYLIPPLKPFIDTSSLVGANAAIMAIAIATTTLAPDYRLFRNLNGGIPLWVLTMLYVIIGFAGIASENAAYHIAHLSGGFIGFMFVFSLRKGRDWSIWMNDLYSWFINLFNPEKSKLPAKRIREKVFYKTGGQKPYTKTSNITQQRIDDILDKINQKGYHLLTDEEKNILKRAGEDL